MAKIANYNTTTITAKKSIKRSGVFPLFHYGRVENCIRSSRFAVVPPEQ